MYGKDEKYVKKNNYLNAKCRCQFVIKLKDNKYYWKLFCYLSSHIQLFIT